MSVACRIDVPSEITGVLTSGQGQSGGKSGMTNSPNWSKAVPIA
jgi:hypothetical protein